MKKSLLRKYFSDQILKLIDIDPDRYSYTKTYSSVRYDLGRSELVVTVDVAVRDMLLAFDLCQAVYYADYAIEEGTYTSTELSELQYGKNYMLPIYALRIPKFQAIKPGHKLFGPLRSQCEYAMRIWEDSDALPWVKPEFGALTASRALQFWSVLQGTSLLHDLANFCCAYDDGVGQYTPYVPNLSTTAFGLHKGQLVPHDALMSLSVCGIQQGEILYTTREEY